MEKQIYHYLIKKSGKKHPTEIAQFVQRIADEFKEIARREAYSVGRTFHAEVPPELENFIQDANQDTDQGA